MRRLVYLLLAALLVGVGVYFYVFNKPHEKVEDVRGMAVTASRLCQDFAADEAKANTTYAGKALEVSGVVAEFKKNQDGNPVITLSSDDADLSVQCTMREKTATAEVGKPVVIKGFFSSNDMFGPTLTDCVLSGH